MSTKFEIIVNVLPDTTSEISVNEYVLRCHKLSEDEDDNVRLQAIAALTRIIFDDVDFVAQVLKSGVEKMFWFGEEDDSDDCEEYKNE